MRRTLNCLALVASATLFQQAPALAAESYDNCTGFITSVPATITTQGTWCMDRDLTTSISSGNALTVATNNVIIDCNDFKLGGLAAGPGTNAVGIGAESRMNATVRNCNIRGFGNGLYFNEGGGHVVEGNRFDGNTIRGIHVRSPGSMVRDNQVMDTGGSTVNPTFATGIAVAFGVDVIDNTVNGVEAVGGDAYAYGIYAFINELGGISGNRVRGLVPTGDGPAYGIQSNSTNRGMIIRDNSVRGPGTGIGIDCVSSTTTARDNVVANFTTGIEGCLSASNTVNTN